MQRNFKYSTFSIGKNGFEQKCSLWWCQKQIGSTFPYISYFVSLPKRLLSKRKTYIVYEFKLINALDKKYNHEIGDQMTLKS